MLLVAIAGSVRRSTTAIHRVCVVLYTKLDDYWSELN